MIVTVWGSNFGGRISGLGITSLWTPIRAPRANTYALHWVRTVRRECLDHLIPLSERHLRAILSEFVDYYNYDRPHRSLGLQAPSPTLRNRQGGIIVRAVLGGLHHVYERAA
jgi:transposase InsO family protein